MSAISPRRFGSVLAAILLSVSTAAGSGGDADVAAGAGDVLTLAASLDAAGRCSLELKEARERLIAAEIQMVTARAGYWPKVSASVDYVMKDNYREGEPGPARPYLAFSKTTLNEWDKVRELKAAITDLYAAKLSFEQTRLTTLKLAGEKYFNLLSTQDLADLAGSRVESGRRDVLELEGRLKVGLVPELSVFRARAGMIRSMTELQTREGDLRKARMALETALCLPRGSSPRAVRHPWTKEVPDRKTSRELGVRNSPEPRILREALAQMQDLGEWAKWTRWPQFGARGFLGYNPDDFNNKNNWIFIVTASQDLFDGGASRRRIEATNSEIRKLQIETGRMEKEIADKIDMLFLDLEVSDRILAVAGEQQESVNRMMALTRRGFDLGALSYKELQDAQSLADDQETSLSVVQARKRDTEFKIMLLTGLLEGPEGK